MKLLLKIIFLLLPGFSFAQNLLYNHVDKNQADSLLLALPHTNNDTLKMLMYSEVANYFVERNNTAANFYFTKGLALTRKLKQPLWEARALLGLSYVNGAFGNYPQSLKFANAGISIAENDASEKNAWRVTEMAKDGDPHKARLYLLSSLYEKLSGLYQLTGNNTESLLSTLKSLKIAETTNDEEDLFGGNSDLANYYLQVNKLDSALFFAKIATKNYDATGDKFYRGVLSQLTGQIYFHIGNIDTAKKYFFEAIKTNEEQDNQTGLSYAYNLLSELYRSTGKSDSSIYFAGLALKDFATYDNKPGINQAYSTLSAAYKLQGNPDSAFFYLQHSKTLGDSLNEAEKTNIRQYMNVGFDEQLKVEELEKEKIQVQTRIRTYVLLTGIGIFVIIAFILYRNNKQKQKSNQLLRQQKEKVESTLTELKSTQSQLIQFEKMASLGELTAGIAHEIQNPLNFVNNFSEVSTELIDEMKAELSKSNYEDANSIADDLKQNLEKINHHGKRADSIVKGMLEHSKASTGKKEPTDINKLADEYLRLSYHGLRAKDKDFNAEIKTDFDNSIDKINIIPQDIGRVLLNLFNNAFYAVNEQKSKNLISYEPTVSVTTKKSVNSVLITVSDNGNGIRKK